MINKDLEAQRVIKAKHGNKYAFLEHYNEDNIRRVKLKCNEHNKQIDVKYFEIIKHESNNCEDCYSYKQSQRKRNTEREVKNSLLNSANEFIKENYYFLELTDKKNKRGDFFSELKCNFHDVVFYQINSEVGKHKACPLCKTEFRGRRKTNEEIKKDTFERLNKIGNFFSKRFEYLGFKKSKGKIKVNLLCKKHRHPYPFWTYKNRINERICNRCIGRSKSLGVIRIEDYLFKHRISFIEEHRFSDCKNTFTLPFDFYLKKENLLIEYDGEQHFKPRRTTDGEKKFKEGLKRDIIKNNYALEKEIKLLRIPYSSLNRITEILDETFRLIRNGEYTHINYEKEILKEYKNLYKDD